jgi:hypothetical protein
MARLWRDRTVPTIRLPKELRFSSREIRGRIIPSKPTSRNNTMMISRIVNPLGERKA